MKNIVSLLGPGPKTKSEGTGPKTKSEGTGSDLSSGPDPRNNDPRNKSNKLMARDFTYLDDIVEGIVRVMHGAPERKKGEDGFPVPPYAIYNIGEGQPESLLDFVSAGVRPRN